MMDKMKKCALQVYGLLWCTLCNSAEVNHHNLELIILLAVFVFYPK